MLSRVSRVSLWCSCVWGRLSSPPPGRFRQSRRRICRAEIRRTEGVEASALCREKRNTQDNNYYHLRTTQRAFMQRVQRCTVLRVRAGAGEWRGPWQRRRESVRILARSAEGRGRSTGPVARPDSTLLSVLPFTDNSVCDGGDIHSEVSSQPRSRS